MSSDALTEEEIAQALRDFPTDEDIQPRTLLEVWQFLLGGIEEAAAQRPRMQNALAIVRKWPSLRYQDVKQYHQLFHDWMKVYRSVLTQIIEETPEALDHIEDDAEFNRDRYLKILYDWQEIALLSDLNWDSDDVDSHIQLAAAVDASAFFLSDTGIVNHLDRINFEVTDEEAEALTEKLQKHLDK